MLHNPRADVLVTRACVGSGFCCKKAPCPYGERDRETGWCVHLTPWGGDDLEVPRYRCGRYEFIRSQPGWQYMPAFGAGCSSTLFNEDRDRVLTALVKRDLKVFQETSTIPRGGVLSDLVADDDLLPQYPWAVRVERFEEGRLAPAVVFIRPRSEWAEGPWKSEVDVVEWRKEGLPYPLLIVRGQAGSLCGYVGVSERHSFHGVSNRAKLQNSELHEEITAARPCGPIFTPTGEPPACWWLGFDCGAYPCYHPAIPDLPGGHPQHYVALAEMRERVEAFADALSRLPVEKGPV